jgi:hypothetical protein
MRSTQRRTWPEEKKKRRVKEKGLKERLRKKMVSLSTGRALYDIGGRKFTERPWDHTEGQYTDPTESHLDVSVLIP